MTHLPDKTTSLYLIRHGETSDEFKGRCYGSLDVPLSAQGVEQMSVVARSMCECKLSAIYTSPRVRCLASAEFLAAGRKCKTIPMQALTELDFGSFEGKSYSEIEKSHPELYATWMQHPTAVQFPGGESFAHMRDRVLHAMQKLRERHAGDSFAVVTHGGVNRIALASAMGLSLENIFRLAQRYAAINLIRYYGEYPVIEMMNGRVASLGE